MAPCTWTLLLLFRTKHMHHQPTSESWSKIAREFGFYCIERHEEPHSATNTRKFLRIMTTLSLVNNSATYREMQIAFVTVAVVTVGCGKEIRDFLTLKSIWLLDRSALNLFLFDIHNLDGN